LPECSFSGSPNSGLSFCAFFLSPIRVHPGVRIVGALAELLLGTQVSANVGDLKNKDDLTSF
jgi:hypothetical protein